MQITSEIADTKNVEGFVSSIPHTLSEETLEFERVLLV